MTRQAVITCDRCKNGFLEEDRPRIQCENTIWGEQREVDSIAALEDLCPKCTLSFLTWLKAEADKS